MDVVAVSFAEPQWLDIDGNRTWTSIIHQTTAAIHLTRDGIEQNALAAHDAAVYINFAHHYDYWTRKLGLSADTWQHCHWGENILLKSDTYIDENEIHLGDKWKIGEDVILQVCGARVPCFKLSWRCGQKSSWLAEVARTGFSGAYMRVLRGGTIHVGDRANIIEAGASSISVALISRLAFEGSMKTKETLNLIAKAPDLLSMNRILFARKLSMIHDQEIHKSNHWKGWREFRVSKIVAECHNIKSFYLEPVDKMPLGTYLPGQFATIRIPNGTVRTWTISDFTSQEKPNHYRLTIKLASERGASAWMHTSCKPYTKLLMRAPAGSFHIDWSPMFPGRQVYVSAGVGITPMPAMLKAHFMHHATALAPAHWIHVTRDESTLPLGLLEDVMILYRARLGHNSEFQVQIFLTGTGGSLGPRLLSLQAQADGCLNVTRGRIPSTFWASLVVPYKIDPLNIKPIEIEGNLSTFYLCGPGSFMTATRAELRKIKVPDAMIRTEEFTAAFNLPETTDVTKAEVSFLPSQKKATWNATEIGEEGQSLSILELAEREGLAPAYGCRAGICGACKVKLVKGCVSGGMQPDGQVLVCSSRPASEAIEIMF